MCYMCMKRYHNKAQYPVQLVYAEERKQEEAVRAHWKPRQDGEKVLSFLTHLPHPVSTSNKRASLRVAIISEKVLFQGSQNKALSVPFKHAAVTKQL